MISLEFLSLFILTLSIIDQTQMTTIAAKTCWPELIGKTADEATQVIKQESGWSITAEK